MTRNIFWPVAPTMSEITLASWMFIWASAFCVCWTWRDWLRSSLSRWREQPAPIAD